MVLRFNWILLTLLPMMWLCVRCYFNRISSIRQLHSRCAKGWHDHIRSLAVQLRFYAIAEDRVGRHWQNLIVHCWPAYRAWFLAHSGITRPALETAVEKRRCHLPALALTFERLLRLRGSNATAARFQSDCRQRPYLIKCSQAKSSTTALCADVITTLTLAGQRSLAAEIIGNF